MSIDTQIDIIDNYIVLVNYPIEQKGTQYTKKSNK